jgi:peptidoglycan-associated lipoprotein
MTKSATTQTTGLPKQEMAVPATFSWGRATFTLLLRLLLLGVGGSIAAAVGVAVAQLYPSQAEEPPTLEKLIRSSESLADSVKHLPETWNKQDWSNWNKQPAPVTVAPPAPSPTAPALTDAERQQLQAELTQLQAELQTLTSKSTEPLADRVQQIQKRIQTIQERLNSFSSPKGSTETFVVPAASSTVDSKNHLMVTLPSDALFDGQQTTLKSGVEPILSSIATELQRYPGATIRVMAHTDSQGSSETDRQRSLEQAKAVRQYLATKLGDSIHWVTIGYGHNRPLVPDNSPENQQRNRRIEIVIEPK